MQTFDRSVRSVALPEGSRATRFFAKTNLADAFAVQLPDGAVSDPEQLARFIFEHQPAWITRLMHVRDALVVGFGLKTARALRSAPQTPRERRVAIFRIYETGPHEILLGEDDKHLDFRVSVMTRPAAPNEGRQLIVSTVVHCHNALGRAYILLIAPFHRRVVRACLERAGRVGWPTQLAA